MKPKKKKPQKLKTKDFIIKIPVDSKTLDFYQRLGKSCRLSAGKVCLVLLIAEAMRIDDANEAKKCL